MRTTASRSRASNKSLDDLFTDELSDMYNVEKRLVRALPKMARGVKSDELREAIEQHLQETEGHVQKLERVFEAIDMAPKAKKCAAMVGILDEGDEILGEFKGSQAADAAIICAAQKVEHYEIATYGCLHEWAGRLGKDEASTLLEEILAEEKNADATLTEIARNFANEEAEEGSEEESEEEDEEEESDEEVSDEEEEEEEPTGRRGRR